VVWALGERGLAVPGLDLRVESTVPVGAGLSSSAALECAVAVAVVTLLGHDLDDDLRDVLAQACIRAETEVARAPTGGMDQTVALRGRADHAVLLDFAPDGLPLTREVPLDLAAAGLALLVTDTRVSHALVDGGYGDRREECRRAAELLGVASLRDADLAGVEALDDDLLRARARHVVTEDDRVTATVAALEGADHQQVGSLMQASHASMRDDFAISCAELDLVVETAVGAGALGSRMTGGGFGGSAVSLVRRDDLGAVADAVDAAFAAADLRAPVHLEATASPGARVVLGGGTASG
jgi:galactokinase